MHTLLLRFSKNKIAINVLLCSFFLPLTAYSAESQVETAAPSQSSGTASETPAAPAQSTATPASALHSASPIPSDQPAPSSPPSVAQLNKEPSATAAPEPPPQADSNNPQAKLPEANKELPMTGKFSGTFFGFIAAESIYDSTQSFDQLVGSALIKRPGTYEGDNSRFTIDVRRTRFGYRIRSPKFHDMTVSGTIELDLRGRGPERDTEALTFRNPMLRVRHAMIKVDTPYVDLTLGLWWSVFGFTPNYLPPSLTFGLGPGEPVVREIQMRVSRLFKLDPVHIEVALAGAKSPEQDTGLPQAVGGVRIALPGWSGAHAVSNLFVRDEPASIAVSGVVRPIKVPEPAEQPKASTKLTGYALAFNALVPVIPVHEGNRAHALTLSGMATLGAGNSDLIVRGGGGATLPSLPAEQGKPARPYPTTLDPGIAGLDSAGKPVLIQWRSYRASLEYYLPPSGDIWLSANAQLLESPNIDAYAPKGLKRELWFDANALWNVTPAFRLGLQYAHFQQKFVDGIKATNHRGMLSAFYFF